MNLTIEAKTRSGTTYLITEESGKLVGTRMPNVGHIEGDPLYSEEAKGERYTLFNKEVQIGSILIGDGGKDGIHSTPIEELRAYLSGGNE